MRSETQTQLGRENNSRYHSPERAAQRLRLRSYHCTILDESMEDLRSYTMTPAEFLEAQRESVGPPEGEGNEPWQHGDQVCWEGKRVIGVWLVGAKGEPVLVRLRDDDGSIRFDVDDIAYDQAHGGDEVVDLGDPPAAPPIPADVARALAMCLDHCGAEGVLDRLLLAGKYDPAGRQSD